MSPTTMLWALRTRWWVVVLGVLAGVALAVGPLADEPPADRRYQATALVVAQELAVRPEQLPRFVEAVFHAGSVAERASAELGGDPPAGELVARYVDVEPLLDTIAARVVGRGPDGVSAAARANAAAEALVAELNEPGPGVGVFALHDEARPARGPVASGGARDVIVLGGAGGLLALGLVALALTIRRPIVDASEAASVAGVPLLGSVRLRRGTEQSTQVVGLAALARRLLPSPGQVLAVIGAAHGGRRVLRLGEHLAAVTSTRFPCEVVPMDGPDVVDVDVDRDVAVVVVGIAEDLDVPQVIGDVPVVLAVVEGTPQRHLLEVVRQFDGGDVEGVVFVARNGEMAAADASRAEVKEFAPSLVISAHEAPAGR